MPLGRDGDFHGIRIACAPNTTGSTVIGDYKSCEKERKKLNKSIYLYSKQLMNRFTIVIVSTHLFVQFDNGHTISIRYSS